MDSVIFGGRKNRLFLFSWRVCFAAILIVSTVLSLVGHAHPTLARPSSPRLFARHTPLQQPLIGLPSSPIRSPLYFNFTKIADNTRPLSNVVAPIRFWHLDQPYIPAPFNKLWGTSAFVDTRPMAIGQVPDVLILATGDWMLSTKLEWPDTPLYCYMAMRRKHGKGSEEMFLRTPAIANPLPDAHIDSKSLVAVFFTCPISDEDGRAVDWEESEIFVTLSPRTFSPPADVFLPVRHLPQFDPIAHQTGHGEAAVCLQPLTGDIYANSMRDFIAFYRLLGFTQFYAYVLDPGPETIAIMRELEVEEGDAFIPVRWMLPLPWLYSQRPYLVHPHDWDIKGFEHLSDELEYQYAFSNHPEAAIDVLTWSFAQNAAHHDCSFRAMANGARWTAMIDWDEFLLLRPPSGVWPPPATIAGGSSFTEWARTVDEGARYLLPSALQFQSAFVCSTCQPNDWPQKTVALESLGERFPGFDAVNPTPAVPSIFTSAVRHKDWFPLHVRSKTIIDPWAWFMRTIHTPIVPYSTYALARCSSASSWGGRATSPDECADPYRSFFRTTTTFLPPPTRLINNSTVSQPPSDHAVGAMYHLRYSAHLTQAQTTWQSMASEWDLDATVAPEGVELLSKARVNEESWASHMPSESEGHEIVQDWSLIETMGAGLLEMLEKREAHPVARWTGQKWVKVKARGAMVSEDGRWWRRGVPSTRNSIVLCAAIGFLVLAWTLRLRSRRLYP